ncbi:MAG: NUDIX hydrolase [Nocardioidaceae bacterium]
MAAEEMVAVVDATGAVLRAERRSVVRRENLLHAATAVLVRNPAGAVYVHRRSDLKDWAPGQHDACAGGVIQYGEEPYPCALREIEEELGITGTTLTPLGTSLYEDDTTRCLEHVFEATWDGPVVYQDAEVVWGTWMTLPALAARLADPTWAFVPDTRQLLGRLAAAGVHDYGKLLHGT